MPPIHWKHTGRFCVASFCMDFGNGMFLAAVPYLAMRMQANSLDLGTLTAFRDVIYVIACLTLPAVLVRVNRGRLLLIAGAGVAFSMVATGLSAHLWHLYAAGILWGLFLSFYWPALFAWLGDAHEPEDLGRATGAINVSWSLGFTTGPLVGGWLYGIAPALPCVLAMVPPLAGALSMAVRSPGHAHTKPEPPGPAPVPGGRRELLSAWVGNISISCLFGLMYGVFPKLGEEELGVTTAVFGWLLFFMGLGRTAVFLTGMAGGRFVYDARVSFVMQLLAATCVALVAGVQSRWGVGLVFVFLGLSLGVNYYRGLYASLASPGSRGRKSGAHEAMLMVGALLGALGGGWLAERSGLRAPYAPTALVVYALVLVQAALLLWAHEARRRYRLAAFVTERPVV